MIKYLLPTCVAGAGAMAQYICNNNYRIEEAEEKK